MKQGQLQIKKLRSVVEDKVNKAKEKALSAQHAYEQLHLSSNNFLQGEQLSTPEKATAKTRKKKSRKNSNK